MKIFVNYGYKAVLYMFLYLVFFGILIYLFIPPKTSDVTHSLETIKTVSEESIYSYIVEDFEEALDIRLALIDAAEETIDISSYAIHPDYIEPLFYGALINAANRGVTIRLIVDGFIEGGIYSNQAYANAIASHDNITLHYYEPFSLINPQAVQNRLHDKLFIIDNHYGLITGRNIGARYFDETHPNATHDRDLLLFGDASTKVVQSMSDYYDSLFNSPFSVQHDPNNKSVEEVKEVMLDAYINHIKTQPIDLTLSTVHLNAIEVDNAYFISNPLTRYKKAPIVLNTLLDIAENYDDLIVQTPYYITDNTMVKAFEPLIGKSITLITNNYRTNPNALAVSGYLRSRDDLAEHVTLYEYQGKHNLHAKSMTFGDDLSVIGSFNVDPRSTYLSTESVIIIYSETFNSALKERFSTIIDSSLEVNDHGTYIDNPNVTENEASRFKELGLNLLKYLTWYFDVML